MDRRHFLRSFAATGVAAGTTATAGCAGVLGNSGAEGTVLGPPEQTRGDPVHPIHGDEMPEFTVPDPITGEEISTEQFEGERAFLWTSFYTNCPDGVCPALILRLRRAQEYAAEKGFGDEAAFLPLTFDPERDTSQVLHEYAGQQGVDLDAGNWHFLRPESYEAGKELMMDSFGLKIEKTDGERYENLEYAFPHYGLILLVNKQGIVERSYPRGPSTDIEALVDDFERVVTA
ncbi:SCO family protein [Halorubrum lacusprofundi]|jgi:protein SCO1/2|uniref:Electron transport protein SCO1/SenC n=1 Tax=Halorubrum lacusprofundi (strain ATCC 49239 / DSM 5036 / JCM 8891 / ACAM 34) TaxID=416348 RepID=B9LPC8_HALLT|nr:SCO family protein [Halorubrum lacusprofundi]ACM57216.1 electron transport protein SCO1/SenC [Halorubrum lacusprofundi ATCC 49239]MCG1007259.1 SCO family protein [Halorubrum lacusprofundi]